MNAERCLSLKDVANLTSLSRATIDRKVASATSLCRSAYLSAESASQKRP
jgi:predicted DNA-binding transcriptional regulator AlpA